MPAWQAWNKPLRRSPSLILREIAVLCCKVSSVISVSQVLPPHSLKTLPWTPHATQRQIQIPIKFREAPGELSDFITSSSSPTLLRMPAKAPLLGFCTSLPPISTHGSPYPQQGLLCPPFLKSHLTAPSIMPNFLTLPHFIHSINTFSSPN